VFDYTQKAEYWALVWGTVVMVLTGLILWFPAFATQYMPAWVIRVSEVVHFYEAILAVGAIIIWHWFFVIFLPQEYPMSTVWLDGRYPAREWKEFHRGEYEQVGPGAIRHPGSDRRGEDPDSEPEGMVTSAPATTDNGEREEAGRSDEPRKTG
jgi:cytochrome b subunit of formate dehydrogenase